MRKPSILLNGASSAGKTSAADAICQLNSSFSHFSIDAFIEIALSKNKTMEGDWPQIQRAFARSAAIKIASGRPLIIETVCWNFTTPIKLFERIPKEHLFIVGLRPSLETLIRREKDRGDRPLGIAMEQFIRVHQGIQYDLEIDSTDLSSTQVAQTILNALHKR